MKNRIPAKSKKRSPISLRVTHEEREQLLADAGNQSLSQHIRARLFGDQNQSLLNTVRISPQSRQRLLVKILMQLGKTNIAQNLSQLAEAVRIGLIDPSLDVQAQLDVLHIELRELRHDLLKALGLHPDRDGKQ